MRDPMRTALVVCAALLATACDGATGTNVVITLPGQPVTRTDPVRRVEAGEKPSIVVDSPAGSVTLAAAEGKEVVVEAVRSGPTDADLDRIRVTVEKGKDDVVSVGWTADGDRNRLSVAFTIRAPKESGLAVKTGAGSVSAEGFAKGLKVGTGGGSVKTKGVIGDLELRTKAGSVEVLGSKGTVVVDTGGGSIDVGDHDGELKLETVAGSIDVRCGGGKVAAKTGGGRIQVRGRPGDLSLETAAGSIEADGAKGTVRAKTGGGSIRIDGDLTGDCSAETIAGSIEIRIPEKSSLVVTGRTQAGSVDTNLPLEVSGNTFPRTVSGTLGDGKGGTLKLGTGGGSIEIRKR